MLREQGFSPIGPAIRGELQTGGLIAYSIQTFPSACYTVAVFGEQPGQNIDLIVLDNIGRMASHDVRDDAHPWASFCTSAAGTFIARLQMAAGAGSYYYAAYQGPAGRQMELSSFFGQQAEQGPQVAQMDAETQTRLQGLDSQLSGQGYTRVGQPSGLMLENASPREYRLNLQANQCYAFATLGGPGAVNTDVSLNDSTGAALVSDNTSSVDTLIQYCAPVDGSYALQIRMAQGAGAIFTVGYVRGNGQPSGGEVLSSTTTAGAGLQENFALLDADMRARGYETLSSSESGNLTTGASRRYNVNLEGGHCYAILAVGDAGVRNLDLVLMSPTGQPVDRDVAENARPTVRVCPGSSGPYTMEVRMAAGSGSYVYAPYQWPRGTEGPFNLRGLIYVRLAEVTALLSVEGYTPDPGFTQDGGTLRPQGATATHGVDLEAGQCYAVVVVGGDGVQDLDVTLARNGSQIASDYGSQNAFPSVRHCATEAGRYDFTVTAARGSGRYHYQVFTRSEE